MPQHQNFNWHELLQKANNWTSAACATNIYQLQCMPPTAASEFASHRLCLGVNQLSRVLQNDTYSSYC